jgi:hypothetical protein
MVAGNGKARERSTKTGTYDAFKDYGGKRYTGMKVGRGHKWRYDEGDWIEKKVTPEKWEIRFTSVKRRRGHAPEGTGVPVGTEYHWYVLADQSARKLDANNYQTEMVGFKFKLAHKRADKGTWSASDSARRNHLVKILKQMIADLESGAVRTAAPEIAPPAEAARTRAKSARTNGHARATSNGRSKPKTSKRRAANGRHLAAA